MFIIAWSCDVTCAGVLCPRIFVCFKITLRISRWPGNLRLSMNWRKLSYKIPRSSGVHLVRKSIKLLTFFLMMCSLTVYNPACQPLFVPIINNTNHFVSLVHLNILKWKKVRKLTYSRNIYCIICSCILTRPFFHFLCIWTFAVLKI